MIVIISLYIVFKSLFFFWSTIRYIGAFFFSPSVSLYVSFFLSFFKKLSYFSVLICYFSVSGLLLNSVIKIAKNTALKMLVVSEEKQMWKQIIILCSTHFNGGTKVYFEDILDWRMVREGFLEKVMPKLTIVFKKAIAFY